MTSQYELDSQRISWIQFHSGWSMKKKNQEMIKIEKKMEKQEQLELDGKGMGYYE